MPQQPRLAEPQLIDLLNRIAAAALSRLILAASWTSHANLGIPQQIGPLRLVLNASHLEGGYPFIPDPPISPATCISDISGAEGATPKKVEFSRRRRRRAEKIESMRRRRRRAAKKSEIPENPKIRKI
jgi:hypothetical protein